MIAHMLGVAITDCAHVGRQPSDTRFSFSDLVQKMAVKAGRIILPGVVLLGRQTIWEYEKREFSRAVVEARRG